MGSNMRNHMLALALSIALASLLFAPASNAADQIVPLPEGWHADSDLFAASVENLAVPIQSSDAAAGWRVLQVRGSDILPTDLAGRISSLSYSFDGQRLLAQHAGLTQEERPSLITQVSMIGQDGATLWTKTDDRTFEFSTTGEVVYAWSEEKGTGLRSDVEIFDLNGKHVRTLPISKYAADSALPIFDGKRALVVIERALVCIDFAQDGAVVWRYDLGRSEPDIVRLFALAPDKILLQLAEGHFKLFQPSGTLAYEYDPETVALTYPDASEAQYKQLAPEAGPNGCSISIFDGTPHARQIQLATSKLFKKYVSLDAPGYRRVNRVVAGKLLFVSPTALLIRSLKDDFKEAAPDADPAPGAAPDALPGVAPGAVPGLAPRAVPGAALEPAPVPGVRSVGGGS